MTFQSTLAAALLTGTCAVAVAVAAPAHAQQASYNIPAGSLKQALDLYVQQSGRQVIYRADQVTGAQSAGVRGAFSADAALDAILRGSGFAARHDASGAVAIVKAQAVAELPQDRVADILVIGTQTQNADVERTRDDAQPYVVISGEEITRSGASNLEQFLQSRLPMNSQRTTTSQASANVGQISFRGLSTAETLILVDGRRLPSVGISTGSFGQPNINGIPLSSIERVEILPSTAGGIYGGNATGGVINIVLKRELGLTVDASYGNNTRWDSDDARISVNGGFSLEGGKTRVTFGATLAEQGSLSVADRSFQRDARALNWANRPADFTSPLYSTTPNICAVASATGTTCTSTPLTIGGNSIGSAYTSVPVGYAGVASDGTAALANAAGQPNFDSLDGAQSLFAGQRLQSYLGSIRRNFGEHVEVYFDGAWDQTITKDYSVNQASVTLAAGDASSPFDQNIRVSIPLVDMPISNVRKVESARLDGGIIAHLPTGGTLALEKTWSQNSNTLSTEGSYYTALSASNAQAFLKTVALTDVVSYPPDLSSLGLVANTSITGPVRINQDTTTLRFAQPVFALPGGDLTISGYLEQRIERGLDSTSTYIYPTYSYYSWAAPKRRRVNSAYAEVRLPIFSPENDKPFLHQLELFGSARHDSYRSTRADGSGSFTVTSPDGPYPSYSTVTNGVASTSYTAAIKYAPVSDIAFRASYGTGFLPPDLSQLTTSSFNVNYAAYSDPKRGNEALGLVTLYYGGSPDLKAEKSKSFSAGTVVTPSFIDGLRISVDWTHISKTDELGSIPIANLLLLEDQFPGRVVRGATQAGDPAGWAGPITGIYSTSFNVARTKVKAWDFQADYSFGNDRIGTFHAYLIGTHQTELARQVLDDDPLINRVGYASAPLRWKGNFGIDWSKGPVSVAWNAQYFDRYRVCSATISDAACDIIEERQGAEFIPSQLYNDIVVKYNFGERTGSLSALSNLVISLSVFNIFDHQPPLIATTTDAGYDLNGDPRLRRFQLGLSKRF